MVSWNINYQCTCCLHGEGRNDFDASLVALSGPLKRLDFQGPPLPIALAIDLPASKSSPSAINRNIGNFWYMSFARCHFRAQKSLDFQGPPLPIHFVPLTTLRHPLAGQSEFTSSRWGGALPPPIQPFVLKNLKINSDM
jgi:hypothetical protein